MVRERPALRHPAALELPETVARVGGDAFCDLRPPFVERAAFAVDLHQAPAVAAGGQADHQQRLETELLEQRGLLCIGVGIAAREAAGLTLLDDLLRQRKVRDQKLVTVLERAPTARELLEPDEQVADDSGDRAG